jgi:hypothetical protein
LERGTFSVARDWTDRADPCPYQTLELSPRFDVTLLLELAKVAERFEVNPNVVYYWIEHGVIQARRLNSGTPYWITVSETAEQKLRDWVRNSRKIHTAS